MSDSVFEGKNLAEALASASAKLGMAEADLDYEIVEQGRRGLFGLGHKSVQIRVMPPIDQETKAAGHGELAGVPQRGEGRPGSPIQIFREHLEPAPVRRCQASPVKAGQTGLDLGIASLRALAGAIRRAQGREAGQECRQGQAAVLARRQPGQPDVPRTRGGTV